MAHVPVPVCASILLGPEYSTTVLTLIYDETGIARLHMDSDPDDQPVRFSVEGDGTAMETDSRGASQAQPNEKTTSGEAKGTEGQRTAHPVRKKQVEFDGDGWEDVGDSGDDEDNRLFGCVGEGEDDYYDPDMDDLDQQFVDNRRLRHMPKTARLRSVPKPPKLSKASTRKSEHSADGLHTDSEKPPSAMPDDAPSSASDAQPTAPGGASCEDGKMDEAEGAASGAASDARGEEGQPSPWKAYVAPTGHEYYHNAATGETTWVKPDGYGRCLSTIACHESCMPASRHVHFVDDALCSESAVDECAVTARGAH